MSKRGESLLVGIGMMPKKKPHEAADPDADEESTEESDDEGGEELPEHVLMSAEKLCRLLSKDEESAPEIGKLIRAIAMG